MCACVCVQCTSVCFYVNEIVCVCVCVHGAKWKALVSESMDKEPVDHIRAEIVINNILIECETSFIYTWNCLFALSFSYCIPLPVFPSRPIPSQTSPNRRSFVFDWKSVFYVGFAIVVVQSQFRYSCCCICCWCCWYRINNMHGALAPMYVISTLFYEIWMHFHSKRIWSK